MTTFLKVTSILLGLFWVPIIYRFFIQWRLRQNPVSLAICLALILLAYGDLLAFVIYSGFDMVLMARAAWAGLQVLGCLLFYLSFWWADAKYRGERKLDQATEPSGKE